MSHSSSAILSSVKDDDFDENCALDQTQDDISVFENDNFVEEPMGEEDLYLQEKQIKFYISGILNHRYVEGNEENEQSLIFECEFSREPVFVEGTIEISQ